MEARTVLLAVLKHVDEGLTHFARSPEHVCAVAIADEMAGPSPRTVQRFRESHEEPLHPTAESDFVPRFDEEVEMV